jgi:hypothetical protein
LDGSQSSVLKTGGNRFSATNNAKANIQSNEPDSEFGHVAQSIQLISLTGFGLVRRFRPSSRGGWLNGLFDDAVAFRSAVFPTS